MVFKKGHLTWNKGLKGFQAGEKHPMWGKPRSEATKKKLSDANKGQSRKLSEDTKRKIGLANSKPKVKRICKRCGKTFVFAPTPSSILRNGGQFCSKKCFYGTRITKHCMWCNKEFVSPLSRADQQYCNRICKDKAQGAWHRGDKGHNWRGGIAYLPYCPKFNKELKEKIRSRDNYTCQLCGVKENGYKFHIHHIHYDKKNCNPDLITLCRGCHFKTNGNRDYYESLFMEKLAERGLLI